MMTNDRESSVLFSLNELLVLERERVAEEAAVQAAARAAQLERERSAARAHQELEEQRFRETSLARRAEALREREEEARLEALRAAEIQRAVHAEQQKARLAELSLTHEHERRLAALERDRRSRTLKRALAGAAALLGLSLAVGIVAFRHQLARADAAKAALVRQNEATRQAELSKVALLERELARLSKTQNAQPPPVATESVLTVPAPSRPEPAPRPQPRPMPAPKREVCDPFDPMCGQL